MNCKGWSPTPKYLVGSWLLKALNGFEFKVGTLYKVNKINS